MIRNNPDYSIVNQLLKGYSYNKDLTLDFMEEIAKGIPDIHTYMYSKYTDIQIELMKGVVKDELKMNWSNILHNKFSDKDIETYVKPFEGLTPDESIDKQLELWSRAVHAHNPIRDECLPSFSCCTGKTDDPKLIKAFIEGDEETRSRIRFGSLSEFLPKEVYVAGDPDIEKIKDTH